MFYDNFFIWLTDRVEIKYLSNLDQNLTNIWIKNIVKPS